MKRILSLLIALCFILGACAPAQGEVFLPEAENDEIFITTEDFTEAVEEENEAPGETVAEAETPPQKVEEAFGGGELEVHFIDVGQADAALILCGGKSMLIDGGNAEDSSLIYTYLRKNNISHLDYVIATHPHEDHIGGLPGALSYATVGKVYSPVTDADTAIFRKYVTAVEKRGARLEIPDIGEEFRLGDARVEILGPIHTDYEDINNVSTVLKISHGKNTFLFTGDMERESEQDVLSSGADISADVLKVGHHGSRDSSTYPLLNAVMPEYAVISVGKDNSYGHPTEEALSRLRDADAKILRTDELGDIIFRSNGDKLTYDTNKVHNEALQNNSVSSQSEESEKKETAASYTYVLNTNSKKFHIAGCSGEKNMSAKNRREFSGTREEIIADGYSPCGNCNP